MMFFTDSSLPFFLKINILIYFLITFSVYFFRFWYLCYYLHTSKELESPVCGFSPTLFYGPSWSSSRDVCMFVSLFLCLSDVPFSCDFFCVVRLVQSVPRPLTGAILILSRALKSRMCSGVLSQSQSRSLSRVEP